MRIAVISDVHGNLLALDAVLADIEKRSVDSIVNFGDLLSGAVQRKPRTASARNRTGKHGPLRPAGPQGDDRNPP
ncbi:metallophosphatase family protein [Arthrobacter sp. R1-13]